MSNAELGRNLMRLVMMMNNIPEKDEEDEDVVKEGRVVCKNADGTYKIAFDDGTVGIVDREQITHVAERRSKK